jgi:P-type Mg2+ transporter
MKGQWSGKIEKLYSGLSTSADGLSAKEAEERLAKTGLNTIPDKDKRGWADILVAQIKSPLLLVLIFASLISGYLGEWTDAGIIITIIGASVILGFFQEYKSEKVLSELKRYYSYHAVVLRGREKVQVDSRELVPGDIVFVGLGDIVPADLRIIETSSIVVDESSLTGESRGVEKSANAPKGNPENPQDIKNGLFMGSTVLEGHAKCVVVGTGQETFFGKTAAVFSQRVPDSDFQIGIRKFGNMVIRVIIVMTIVVFFSNYGLGHGGENKLADSALFALALAVGVAPEALPAVISVTLSIGSMHLAKKKVITKKLAAIEDLGNMDILCTDKTGTLTEESLRVERYVDLDKKDSHDVFEYALLCNAAVGTGVHVKGNPIDVAIKKRGHALKADISRFMKIQDIPFDYNRRRMGSVVREGRSQYLIVKGAPESVLSACSKIKISSKMHALKEKRQEMQDMIASYNKEGYSTIGVAYKDIDRKKEYTESDESGLIFIGFVLFSNPPKHDVKSTLDRLKKLNINLKILTGDDALVTKKLCYDVGLYIPENRVILGSELSKMSKPEIQKIVEKYNVFARVSPDQKLAIVEALRENGHVVGFMGDGINDAPALRTADVGISVNTAADVAKGASHIILLKKSLGVVCDGVEEGRKIFGNITKYIINTISANNGNMITVAVSSFFLPFIPLLPTQILLNNLVSDVPLVGIASDNVDKEQTRKPRKWDIQFIAKFMMFFGLISTLFDLLLILILYFVLRTDMDTFRTAWFLESVLSEILIVFSLRTHLSFYKSHPSVILLLTSVGAAMATLFVVYVSPFAGLFHFVPLDLSILALIGGILVAYFAVTEIGKKIFFGRIVEKAVE